MGGGASRVRGTTRRRTAGVTTTGTQGQTDVDHVWHNGKYIEVRPKPLMQKKGEEKIKDIVAGSEADSQSQGLGSGSNAGVPQKSQDTNKSKEEGKKTGEEKKTETSKLDSSFTETSEDTIERKKKEEAEAKKKKKGLTAEQLEELVNIELSETRTQTLLHIPGTFVK